MEQDGRVDAFDPRFATRGSEVDDVDRQRQLVASSGPGRNPDVRMVRILRVAVPALFAGALVAMVLVFFSGLSPGESSVVVGPASEVRQAVAERPYRYCFHGTNPCAWLTVVDQELVAFNTNGPMAEEYGRQGVGWCPSSGYFGSNSTGSRWDQDGRIVTGPSPRSLDRFTTAIDAGGNLVVRFASLTAGLANWQVDGEVSPPDGPDCDEVPFDRDPDLHLRGGSATGP
ncbi:MAG: hypothetical protein ACR2HR_05370 [Euzebya sp.]